MGASVTDGFEKFADEQFMRDAAGGLGGLLVAETIAAAVGGATIPGVGYTVDAGSGVDQVLGGATVVVGAEAAPMVTGRMKRHAQVGGAIGIGHGVAERFGVEAALQNAVSGALGGS